MDTAARPLYLDEVQRGGDSLVRAVKSRVDQSNEPGQFVLARSLQTTRARSAWFRNYVAAVVQRDVREMAKVREPSAADAVLRGLDALSSQTLVTSTIAARADLSRATVDRYVGLLERCSSYAASRPGRATCYAAQ